MKKILTVSLVAIMAVGAAHAQIASTEWVEESQAAQNAVVSALDTRVSTAEQNIGTLGTNKLDKSTYTEEMGNLDVANKGTVAEQIASKVAQSVYNEKMQKIEEDLGKVASSDNFELLKTDVETLQTSLAEGGATDLRFDAVEAKADANATAIGTKDESGNYTSGLGKDVADNTATIGTLSDLTTEEKTSLVGAINEVDAHADANAAKIGTVAEGKNLATMLSEETTARTNADTDLQGQIGTFDENSQTWTGLTGEVKTLETNLETKFAKTSTVKGAVVTTTESGEVAPVVPTESEDGVYVLTATKNGDSVTYYWENIARKTPASEPETPNGEES